ncbi:MAG TPA: hypothetical protein VGP94_09795 [Tepidisphaeraceae bacterium]|nr:hypothetical protein [Tepidisphaeraceae bacterium]
MADQLSRSGEGAAMQSGNARRLPMGIVAVVLIAVAGVVAWKMWPRHLPPTSDTVAVAKFTNSSEFAALPEAKRREYIRALRKNSEPLASARSSGKLSQAEYDVAMSYVWLARQLDHMEGYFELPAGIQREKFLNELAEKSRKAGPSSAPAIANEKTRQKVSDLWMSDWAADRRAQWEEFRKASKSKKGS